MKMTEGDIKWIATVTYIAALLFAGITIIEISFIGLAVFFTCSAFFLFWKYNVLYAFKRHEVRRHDDTDQKIQC